MIHPQKEPLPTLPTDEDELNYFPDKYPAWWQTVAEGSGLYETKEIALREIKSYPEYKTRF